MRLGEIFVAKLWVLYAGILRLGPAFRLDVLFLPLENGDMKTSCHTFQ